MEQLKTLYDKINTRILLTMMVIIITVIKLHAYREEYISRDTQS